MSAITLILGVIFLEKLIGFFEIQIFIVFF